MAAKLKLPYGLREGQLRHISQVENGLACGCSCPGCGAALVARNAARNVKVAHFAHYKALECSTGLQTALHYAAKDIIAQHKRLRLPGASGYFEYTAAFRASFTFDIDQCGEHLFSGYNEEGDFIGSDLADPSSYFYPSRIVAVDEVVLEKRTGDIIPDVLVRSGLKWLLVEVAVTHFVDAAKKAKIEALGLPAFEIDLSKTRRDVTLAALEEMLIEGEKQKKWLNNPALERKLEARRHHYFELCRPELERQHAERMNREALAAKRAKWQAELAAKSDEERKQVEQNKQDFYRKHYRPLTQRTSGPMGPVQHVDGCPRKVRFYFDKPYANLEADCYNCAAYRGRSPDRTNIVCLFDYLKRKQHQA